MPRQPPSLTSIVETAERDGPADDHSEHHNAMQLVFCSAVSEDKLKDRPRIRSITRGIRLHHTLRKEGTRLGLHHAAS